MSLIRAGFFGLRLRSLLAVVALFVAGLSVSSSHAAGVVGIEVLSNRADLISGGDALVRVDLPSGVSASDVTMMLGSTDVTSQFALRPNGKYEGLLTGLALGPNVLKALLPDNSGAQITITNHPSSGPVFSGPQVQPWVCNLVGAVSPQCDRVVTYQFMFKPVVGSGFQSYDPANPPPTAAIAQTTTDQGVTVPYIVRLETGSVDRAQYQIAVLYDPSKSWEPWAPQQGWNHKLFVTGGPGCNLNYTEGSSNSVLVDNSLARGFAVLSTAFLASGHTCYLVVQAESLMMAKEHLIEAYGPIRYTFSSGGSGAAIVQQQVANAYPGLYDGLIPSIGFEGGWDIARQGYECGLLGRYLMDPTLWAPGVVWTEPQIGLVYGNGLGLMTVCGPGYFPYTTYGYNFSPAGAGSANPVMPSGGATGNGGLPPEEMYNAQSNPGGVRRAFQDYAVSVLGRRPAEVWTAPEKAIGHGFGNRPLDNVGVEYGLTQLKAGVITSAQFVDLNAKAGGRDIDWNWKAQRDEADSTSIGIAYRSGMDNEATNLDQVPMINIEAAAASDVHDNYRAWSMRARLDRAHGNHDNQIIWTGAPVPLLGGATVTSPDSFDLMDRWLAAIEADHSSRSRAEKVVANKPADAVDQCTSPCVVHYEGSPRMVAGGPLANDITKCQLKPLSLSDHYPANFTGAQWAQLKQVFPTGVCDFSKPGVAQQPTVPWLTYEDGNPGGGPLGPAPVSTPV